MDLDATITRIAEILEGMDGVVEVYAGRPNDTPPANLPAFIVLTGSASVDTNQDQSANADMAYITRSYRCILLALPWVQGVDLQSEETCRPFFTEFYDIFLDRPMLDNPKGSDPIYSIVSTKPISDSGIINVVLGNVAYAGVEFVLEITEIHARTYA